MKYITIILTLISFKISAQEITIKDILSQKPVEGVSISSNTNNTGVISNNKGISKLDSFKRNDTLIIQHLAYQNLSITKKDIQNNVIFLVLKTHTLDNVEINDSKLNHFKETSIFTKINAIKIANVQSAQTSDLLEKTMGLSIQKSQNGGGSPNLRGMEANRLLIIVDGIALNNTIFRSGHLQNTATINPFFLNSAEVLFGPSAVAFGNGAMGGAIIFRTKRPKNNGGHHFAQQYESSSKAVFTSLTSNYKLGKSINISGFSIKSYGDLRMGNNRKHGFLNWGNESIIVENNIQKETAYQQADFFHKTLFQLTKNNFLLFNSQFSTSSNINRFDKLNDLKDGENKYLYWYYGPQKRILQSVRLKNYKHTVFSNEAVFTASFQDVKESRHKQKKGDNLLNNRNESLQIFDLKADVLKQVNTLKINYGFDSRFQQLESTANLSSNNNIYYNTSRYPDGGTNVLNNAIYIQLNYQGLKNIDLLLGTRYNVNSLSSKFRDTTTIKLPFDEILVENKSLSNSVQMHYKASKSFTFNASISNGFRNPNTDDIGKIFSKDDISVILPNNQLSPEKSFNFETGLVGNFNNQITFQLQVFQTQIIDAIERRYAKLNGNDSIIYDGEMMKVMMNQNIGKATISGLNFAYHINLTKRISHNGSINILKGETSDNLPLAHIPPKNIISELNYSLMKHFISFSIHYNGIKKAENYDLSGVDNLEEATQIGNPSWYTLNLKHKINIDKNLTFITGIYNITDTHYKTFGSGISASGRNFSLSLQAKF